MRTLKYCIIITIICISIKNSFGQNNIENLDIVNEYEFTFDKSNKTVSWEKVFQMDSIISQTDIKSFYLTNSTVKIIQENDLGIIAELVPDIVDYRKYGYKWASTPVYFNSCQIVGNILVEFKQNRYKVTINKIGFRDKSGIVVPKGEVFVKLDGSTSFKDDLTIRTRNKLVFEILNRYFIDKFTYKKLQKKDW